jgi:hypothetical protein
LSAGFHGLLALSFFPIHGWSLDCLSAAHLWSMSWPHTARCVRLRFKTYLSQWTSLWFLSLVLFCPAQSSWRQSTLWLRRKHSASLYLSQRRH